MAEIKGAKTFSDETRGALGNRGYQVYQLGGRSYLDMVDWAASLGVSLATNHLTGRGLGVVREVRLLPGTDIKVETTYSFGKTPADYFQDELEELSSQAIEVAIHPNHSLTDNPYSLSAGPEQLVDWLEFIKMVQETIPGAKANRLGALDLAELAINHGFAHADSLRASLFGQLRDRRYALGNDGFSVTTYRNSGDPLLVLISPASSAASLDLNSDGPYLAKTIIPA